MRFFVALEIPETSREQLEFVQKQIRDLIPAVRLTDSNKLHLTLAFIGDQPENLQKDFADIIKKACTDIPPFSVTPAYLDGFPNIHSPNILWVGVKGDIDKLLLIRERIKDSLEALNIHIDERRFTPHIALAKIEEYRVSIPLEENLQKIMLQDFEPISITAIKLFESIPDKGLHTHNTLAEIKLI